MTTCAKKLKLHGLPLSRGAFVLLDHVVHTVPFAVLLALLVRRRQRVPWVNTMYAAILASWFSFRQQAKLDSSGIYVPHPWRRAWFAIGTGMLATPPLVDSLIRRDRRKLALMIFVILFPWLTTRFDPHLKHKYMFEYAITQAEATTSHPDSRELAHRYSGRARLEKPGALPRVHSVI